MSRVAAAVRVSVIAMLFVSTVCLEAAIPASQRQALESLYNATGGANWSNRTGWMGAPGTECTWFGVYCDSFGNSVVALVLGENNLVGPLPSDIAQLPDVDYLGLWDNVLSGSIPPSIGTMTKMKYLYLDGNRLTGSVPPELANLTALEELSLYENQLTGSIPEGLGNLPALTVLSLSRNQLTGPIPASLGNATNLFFIALNENKLSGPIPDSLRNLTALEFLSLHTNGLTGPIPSWIGELANLADLRLSFNPLSGTIPESIGNLTKLEVLYLGETGLSGTLPASLANLSAMIDLEIWRTGIGGPIPAGLGNLPALEFLYLADNQLSGPIPPDLGSAPVLRVLALQFNQLSGTIPVEFAGNGALRELSVRGNELTGSIPPELGSLPNLTYLSVAENRLTGGIPSTLGNLSSLTALRVNGNALVGEIPSTLSGLTQLAAGQSDFRHNGLFTANAALRAFLNSKQAGGDFESTQTVAPGGITFAGAGEDSATISWTPIAFDSGPGGYRVLIGTSPGGPFSLATTTTSKTASSARIVGLSPSTSYVFKLQTISFASGAQKNDVVSGDSATVSGTTGASQPSIRLASSPRMLTAIADGVSTDSAPFSITNLGQQPATVSLSTSAGFFTLSASTVTVNGGETARISVTSNPQTTSGDYRGSVALSGVGVPDNAVVPVTLFATPPPPQGEPNVVVETTRVDVAGPVGSNPSGTVTFRNIGNGPATGLLGADVPWIVPDEEIVTIEPGATHTFSFTIDRARRPDASALAGTQSGRLSFVYVAGSSSAVFGRHPFASAPTLATPVGVSDTVKPQVEIVNGIPLLKEGEIGLVVPGVGNVTGSVGVFISDLTIANGLSGLAIGDLSLHYISGSTTLSATQPVSSGQSVALADVVSTVFDKTEQIGALHVRSATALQLAMNANVFNKSNASGTYGTAIPVFRSDRAAAGGETLRITGLRKTPTSHTNLYLQETLGAATTALVEFLDAGGTVIGTLAGQPVSAFGTAIIGQALIPEGAVTARVTNESAGGIVSYATPVDRASGDTWALTDWNRLYDIGDGERQLVPVAGSAPGRNNTYFRTDLALTNGGAASTATLRYYQQTPDVRVIERSVEIAQNQTLEFEDVVAGLFAATPPSLGHIELVSGGSGVAMTSRTYTTVAGEARTFGTGVPTLSPAFALRGGQSVVIGGLEDSTAATTNAATPATFRTNVGLVEVDGKPVTVKVSVLLFDGKQLAAGGSTASKTYQLAPREFRQLNAIVSAILGSEARETDFGELKNVQVRVDVVGGEGAAIVYATQTDNGTGDTVLRVQ